jgi:elongation factor 1 alpha-like protein
VTSRAPSPLSSPTKSKSGAATPARYRAGTDQRELDISALNLGPKEADEQVEEEPPKLALARDRLLEEVQTALKKQSEEKEGVNLVVVGGDFSM